MENEESEFWANNGYDKGYKAAEDKYKKLIKKIKAALNQPGKVRITTKGQEIIDRNYIIEDVKKILKNDTPRKNRKVE